MKCFLASALCFLLLLTGCSTPETKEEKPGISGTFTGSAMGMKSTIEVEVVLDNNSISAVNVISHEMCIRDRLRIKLKLKSIRISEACMRCRCRNMPGRVNGG